MSRLSKDEAKSRGIGAAEMRVAGATWREIAETYGFKSPAAAFTAAKRYAADLIDVKVYKPRAATPAE